MLRILHKRAEIPQPFDSRFCALQSFEREIQLLSRRHREEQIPDRQGGISLLPQIAKREEIPLRFGHRHVVDLQELAVDPIFREQLSCRALCWAMSFL